MMGGRGMLVLAALFGGAVFTSGPRADHEVARHYGTPASEATARIVKIDAETRFIRAGQLETLTIQNGKGQSFAWQFDTLHAPTGFPLKSIAPPDFDAGDTWVYVGPKADPD